MPDLSYDGNLEPAAGKVLPPAVAAPQMMPGGNLFGSPTVAFGGGAPLADSLALPSAAPSLGVPTGNRQQTEAFWAAQGVPTHVAQGIADAVGGESGFNSAIMGDSGTSGGQYQHHAERLDRLKTFAAQQGKPWTDPSVQNAFALSEVKGGDPIAAAHWKEIVSAPNRETARALWSRYFERPASSSIGGSSEAAAQAIRGKYDELAGTYRKEADAAIKEASELKGSVYDQMKAVRAALDKSDKSQDAAMQFLQKPPARPEIDGMQKMGGLATVVGILGGLLTRSPLRASMNAAASAIEAYNDGDRERYKTAYNEWKTQSDMMFKIADMNASRVRDVLYAENMGFNERRAAVDVLLRAQGLGALADQAQISGLQTVMEHDDKMRLAQQQYEMRKEQMEFNHELALSRLANNPEGAMFAQLVQQHPEWTTEQQMAAWGQLKSSEKGGAASRPSKPQNIEVTQADGTKKTMTAQQMPDGTWVTPDERRQTIDTSQGFAIIPPSAGRQAETQTKRLIGAGSQMEAHLKNLSEMPIDASIGPFMGLESRTPETLTDALVRTAARGVVTTDAAKAMQNEFIGIGRQIATLDSQGAAQGLVGLAKQAEGYAPLEGDSALIVMRKYASLRQVVEQAMHAIDISGTANEGQKTGAREILASIKASIPYTVHDVNQLQFPPGGDIDRSARTVAEKMLRTAGVAPPEAVTELQAHRDDPKYRASFERHFGKDALDKALAQ